MADQQFERSRRKTGGRRAVADRNLAGYPTQRCDSHVEIAYLFFGRAEALVAVSVVANLVTSGGNLRDCVGISVRGMTGDEPGRWYVPLAQHVEQPLGADHSKLAARDRTGRSGVEVSDPDRDRIEVEG